MPVVHAVQLPPARWSRFEPEQVGARSRLVTAALAAGAVVAVALLVYDCLLARHTTSGIVFDLYWFAFFLGTGATVVCGLRMRNTVGTGAILAAFAVFTCIPKFLMSVSGPRYFDEYGQYRHLNDVLGTGNIFAPNTYQPIISQFPGLTAATLAVHAVTRLSVWHSGQVVIIAAHTAALPIVAAIARRVGASGQLAFIGALVYGLNPSFAFFDVEFSYESLGLPLALLTILACLHSFTPPGTGRPDASRSQARTPTWTWPVVGLVAMTACVLTHHLSSLFADATCVIVGVCLSVSTVRRPASYRLRSGWLVVGYGLAATALWLGLVASSLGGYLAPHFSGAVDEMLELAGLEAKPAVIGAIPSKRTLFAGSQLPTYEKLAAITTPFLALALVAGSVWVLWRTRRSYAGSMPLLVPFVLLAAAYFVSLPFSLTTAGSEISHRSWGYSYLGIAVAVAVAGTRLGALPRPVAVRRFVVAGLMIIPLAVGNTALGVDVSYRFPGPYEFGTDTRSGSPELMTMVAWLNAHVPAGTGVVADRFTSEYVEGYSRLRIPSPDQVLPLALFVQPLDPAPPVSRALRQGGFRYFVLDKRILTETPHLEFYPGASTFLPVNVAALRALVGGRRGTAELTAVFSNQHYAVFRIGR